jgi:hypothetical protein
MAGGGSALLPGYVAAVEFIAAVGVQARWMSSLPSPLRVGVQARWSPSLLSKLQIFFS